MPPLVLEWLNLVVRWIHVLAAIMWIGDSLLFMWMDASLSPPRPGRDPGVAGELWMVHSGGFYEVLKRRALRPEELPANLHWFKWQSYTTWISGVLLLAIVYWLGSGVVLEAGPGIGHGAAVALGAGLLAAGWLVYDAVWRSPLGRRPALAATLLLALLAALAWALPHTLSPRAAYLEVGAVLGTIMTANVLRVIIPAQDRMLAATRAGTPVDTSHGARAKVRSVHNHYLTLPVLFIMLSNHFPSTYGHPLAWLVLMLVTGFGLALKYVMNHRAQSDWRVAVAGVACLAGAVTMTAFPGGSEAVGGTARMAPVPFAQAEAIVGRRCLTCHATHPSNPSFPQPPNGVALDAPARLRALAPRILVRAVQTRTMPLGNLTGMTDAERDTLGAWIAQGARLDAR